MVPNFLTLSYFTRVRVPDGSSTDGFLLVPRARSVHGPGTPRSALSCPGPWANWCRLRTSLSFSLSARLEPDDSSASVLRGSEVHVQERGDGLCSFVRAAEDANGWDAADSAPGRKGTVVGGAVRGSGSGPGALGCPRHAHTFARCPFPDPPRSWDSSSSGFWALRPYQGSSTRVP